MRTCLGPSVVLALFLVSVATSARARAGEEPAPVQGPRSVFSGHVVDPRGAPAEGAVVLSSAGGQAVTDANGAFWLEVELPVDAERVQVTAALGSGEAALVASSAVGALVHGAANDVGTLQLAAAGCEPGWLPTFGPQPGIGLGGVVRAFAVIEDNGPKLYVCGTFSIAGSVSVNNLARWDGVEWARPPGGDVDGTVSALVVGEENGEPVLYVGGNFTKVGAVFASDVARWTRSEGWSKLGLASTSNTNGLRSLALFDDGNGTQLYVGSLESFGLRRWDGVSWQVVGGGVTGSVHALCTYDDGSGPALYAGGFFNKAGGLPMHGVARWDGTAWSALGDGIASSAVYALAVYDDGAGPALYAGGDFEVAGGVPALRVARWDGATWSAVGGGIDQGLDPVVYALHVYDDGSGPALYAAGEFAGVAGVGSPVLNVAKWDGTAWSGLGEGVSDEDTARVLALTSHDSGSGPRLWTGGDFGIAGEKAALGVALWDGSDWATPTTGFDGAIAEFIVHDDGSGPALYAGGAFSGVDGVTLHHIGRWDGQAWSPLGDGLDDNVFDLEVFDDGSGPALYAAGLFRNAGGSPDADGIARWDGRSWSSLGTGSTQAVTDLAVFDDGSGAKLYAGGSFSDIGGIIAINLAVWDGQSWSALPGPPRSAQVTALEVADLGDGPALYAGGLFVTIGGVAAPYIAKYDGSVWSSLGTGMNSWVLSLEAFDDGDGPALYAGGYFQQAGSTPANRIAKWNGTTWSALGSGMSDAVSELLAYDDGSGPALYAGGHFETAGGVAASHVARWDGAAWSPLGSGTSGVVAAFAVFDTGDGPVLHVGGSFELTPDSGDSFLSRWGGCAEPVTPWTDLGGGTAGVAGVSALTLSGPLTPDSQLSLDLVDGAPSSLALLFLSLSSTPASFLGGTLHAFPFANLFVLVTDPAGELHGAASFPGAPAGTPMWFQVGLADPSVPVFGASLSNGVKGIVP